MRTRWFGEPWPSDAHRAGVCEEDIWRIKTPTGVLCMQCDKPILEDERGVAMPCFISGMPDDHLFEDETVRPELGEVEWTDWKLCAFHIDCHVRNIMGPDYDVDSVVQRVP